MNAGLDTATLLLLTLDLLGTLVFALSGAAAGVRHRLDVFGIGVVAFVAGNAGGLTRDVLIGAVPPAAIGDARYIGISLLAGAVMFWWGRHVTKLQAIVQLLDASGLGLFAVAGTQKALAYGVNPFVAPFLGMLTGIGGGIVRDLLINEIPVVLRSELYAVAALLAGAVVVAGALLQWPATPVAIGAAALCFVLRLAAIRRGWNLPVARHETGA